MEVWRAFTEPSFFDIFGFELQKGNEVSALAEPFSIIITEETAKRYFGSRNVVGKTFAFEGLGIFTVTGVLKPAPNDTHLRFDVLASLSTIPLLNQSIHKALTGWDDYKRTYTYVLTKPGTASNALNKILPALSSNISENFELNPKISVYSFHVQQLANITPGKYIRGMIGAGKTRSFLELFLLAVVAFIILLMACFNYTNLSIAGALKRAREVGIYKIFGAGRFSIFTQFAIQAVLISAASLLVAYALLPVVPLPHNIMQEMQNVNFDFTLVFWLLLFTVFTGLLAGGLPAWLLSSLKPVQMIKNAKNINLIKGFTIRKTLVVAQFALSLILIITTLVIYRQSHFAATTDYGFRQENIINLRLQGADYQLLKNEILKIAGVKKISAISNRFGIFASGSPDIKKEKSAAPVDVQSYSISRNLITNMDLELLAGNNFSRSVSAEKESHIIINKKLATLLNWDNPAEAIGQTVWLADSLQVQIAGVIENFHFESLIVAIRPMILRYQPDEFNYLNIQIASSGTENFTKKLEAVWENVAPRTPIEYSSTREYLYKTHSHENDVASIGFFALIAITIASLGLLGMVTYSVEVRTQEVGIRKVLGAGVGRIIFLLSKEFIWLLAIAALIGLPVGYWFGLQFLSSYAYHISIGLGTVAVGLGIILSVGLFAIGIQTRRIALMNPVEAIQSEA